jgi:hypothetical protein
MRSSWNEIEREAVVSAILPSGRITACPETPHSQIY